MIAALSLLSLSLFSLSMFSLSMFVAPAQADEQDDPLFKTTGEARLIGSLPPAATLDTEGTALDQGFVLDSRLRAGAIWRPGAFKLQAEFDLFDGQLAGDTWGVPGVEDARHREELDVLDGDSFTARRLAMGGIVRVSQVQLIQPFLALLFGVPVLGEQLDPVTVAFSLAVIAVVFVSRRMAVGQPKAR